MKRVRISLVGMGLIILVAVLAPMLAVHDPQFVPRGENRLPPSAEHWFGTDQIGRDVFARVLYGARVSLLVGFSVAVISGIVGTLLGLVAGYGRRWTDEILMRSNEVVLVFPNILLAGVLVMALGRGVVTVIVVLSIVQIPLVARVCRAAVLEVRNEPFVEAARSMGMKRWQVARLHVLPHVLPSVSVVVATSIGTAILAESTLSFLAIGIAEPTPSWGAMVASGRRFLGSDPSLVLFPATAIFLTVLASFGVSEVLCDLFGRERR